MTTNKPEAVAYRYTASRSFGKRNRKWHYQDSFPHAANRKVAEIGQMEELIRLIDYEALQAECEKLRKDAERYRQAMVEVMRQVDGNIRETVRDCVNGGHAVQDIYDYCDLIEEAIGAALAAKEEV